MPDLLITGTTYPIRDRLRRIGRWDAAAKGWIVPAEKWDACDRYLSASNKKDKEVRDAYAGCIATPVTGESIPAAPRRIHPEALTRRGNLGWGPDAMAYDDI